MKYRMTRALRCLPEIVLGKKTWGDCVVCEQRTLFVAIGKHYREDFRCIRCISTERGRALIHMLDRHYPQWRDAKIHEASPYGPASKKLFVQAKNYTWSRYRKTRDASVESSIHQDLQDMTFDDSSFEIFVTQDVLEHVSSPNEALQEIDRVLGEGGLHIWTVPYYPSALTKSTAELVNGDLVLHTSSEFHGNPDEDEGSLVFTRWGKDLVEIVSQHTSFKTEVKSPINAKLGLLSGNSQVFLSWKEAH